MYFQDFLNKHSRTLVMGILNITPDSFYDGNKYYNYSDLSKRFNKMNITNPLVNKYCHGTNWG